LIQGRREGQGGFSGKKPKKSKAKTASFGQGGRYDYPEENPDPLLLKPEVGRLAQVLGLLFFSAFWNGIVSIFVVQVVKGFMKGNPEWFLVVFLIPFVLVGLLTIFLVFYSLLALFNPKIEVTISPGTPRMGEPFYLTWRIEGNSKRLKSLLVILEAEEIATYQRGTDTVTERNIFEQVQLASQEAASGTDFNGTTDLTIPMETMHSFKSRHNHVLWTIKLQGDIPRWPDIAGVFPIEVLPAKPLKS
jgi:hypothetical protein